eukprot:Em0013g707a
MSSKLSKGSGASFRKAKRLNNLAADGEMCGKIASFFTAVAPIATLPIASVADQTASTNCETEHPQSNIQSRSRRLNLQFQQVNVYLLRLLVQLNCIQMSAIDKSIQPSSILPFVQLSVQLSPLQLSMKHF